MWFFGYDLNLIITILLFFIAWMIGFGIYVIFLEAWAPKVVTEGFKYGKSLDGDPINKLIKFIQIPKSYFTHFYIFAVPFFLFIFYLCFRVYLGPLSEYRGAPDWIVSALDFLGSSNRKANTDPESVILAVSLLLIQSSRRLYECLFVNLNTGSKMNFLHYIVGFAHYFCSGTAILLEAPGFVPGRELFHHRKDYSPKIHWLQVHLNLYNYGISHLIFSLIFFWAWIHQFRIHLIFAKCKTKSITNNSYIYSVPEGDWFRWLSCPHYTAEILMYGCVYGILGISHVTFGVVFLWVAVNQTIAGLMSHYWYKERFPAYPRNRKAVIPFLI